MKDGISAMRGGRTRSGAVHAARMACALLWAMAAASWSAVPVSPPAPAVAPAAAAGELQSAWSRYLRTLEEMRVKMEATERFRTQPENRAKAYHTLLEAQAMAYNFAVAPRMYDPRVQTNTGWQTTVYTLGQNGPDFYYGVIFLDGHQSYRLSGRRGSTALVLGQVIKHLSGSADSVVVGNYDFDDFKSDANGRFDITLSANKTAGNWMALDPDSRYQFILIRRLMADWNDDAGEMRIEPIDRAAAEKAYTDTEFDEKAMAERIDAASGFLRYLVESWNIGLHDAYLAGAKGERNKMALLPGTTTSQVGSPVSNYAMAVFDLADDEALIVEMRDVPKSAYWSLQLGDVWSRSLDFRNFQTSINLHEARLDADGSFHAVVSRSDPGIANWLDTRAHHQGTIVFRNYRSNASPVPVIKKVRLRDLKSLLPATTAAMNPEERRQRLEARRRGLTKVYGE